MKIVIAALLIFIGALPSLLFKQLNETNYGIFTIVSSFDKSDRYNTSKELRFMDHGKIIAIERHLHDNLYPYAITALILQYLLWIPSLVIFWMKYKKNKSILKELNFYQKSLSFLFVGTAIAIWVVNFP